MSALEVDAVAADLAGPGVPEHAVDELARAAHALAQEPQDLGVGPLVAAALEQRDEDGHGRDRLAEVVRDRVGVAPQLGLGVPLLGDVVEQDDEPVAELGRAPQQRAARVAHRERACRT